MNVVTVVTELLLGKPLTPEQLELLGIGCSIAGHLPSSCAMCSISWSRGRE